MIISVKVDIELLYWYQLLLDFEPVCYPIYIFAIYDAFAHWLLKGETCR